ncbi:Fur family transcriptional regulator [Rubrolithibacter danxiaensis]|uniref:Fur family transcriptional regulator n=1 Tax=Rubrolithibacter danxiaensis TaxID=3390805 RepID=UPI003BF8C99A
MIKDLEPLLTEKGINPTAMRLLVFDFLLKQEAAVSLADIEKQMEHSDRITLYRTIKTFEEKGLVHRIQDGTGATKYALCNADCSTSEHHDVHVHFYCASCKETFCLPDSKIPEIKLPDKFKLKEMNLVVKGICEKCA